MPSVTKPRGYGKVGASDDAVEVSVQPLPSAADDEILGVDLQSTSAESGGRHRRKKLCVGIAVALLLFALLAKGMAASPAEVAVAVEVAESGGSDVSDVSPPPAMDGVVEAVNGVVEEGEEEGLSNSTRMLRDIRLGRAGGTDWVAAGRG